MKTLTMICALLLLAACSQQAVKTVPTADLDAKPYRIEQEGQVPPLDKADIRKEVDQVDTFEEMDVTSEGVSAEDVEVVPEVVAGAAVVGGVAAVSPANPKTTKVDGYRVQVFASVDEAQARSVSQAVAASVGMRVYVEPEGGMFKVRVGDCATRAEAEKLRNKCQAAGYSDAWIVMAPVIVEGGQK